MKTVRQFFEKRLPVDVLEKAIANTKAYRRTDGLVIVDYLSTPTTNFYDALNGAFIFNKTAEGHKYWEDILETYSDPLNFKPVDPFK